MPIYEYKCKICGFEFEKLQKGDTKSSYCPQCDCLSKRKLSIFNAHYKGSGFYTTDNPKK